MAEATLELGPGLTLLTGETGAGKSILVDALGLVLGARATSDLVRTGEERAVVEAIFEAPGLSNPLESHGIPVEDDGEIVVRREIAASGKGRAAVNGALVPVSVLRALAPHLAVIHGQHEPQGLLDAQTHLEVVDRHGALETEAERLAAPYARLRAAESALEALRRDRRELERRRETLEYQVAEIRRAELQPGEEQGLRGEKTLQANADRLAALSAEAYALLYEAEDAALGRLAQVQRRVGELAEIDPRFTPYLEAAPAWRAPLEDLALFLRDYHEGLQVRPGRLDEIETRLALIERLKKKYGASVDDVLAFEARSAAELATLGSPEEREAALESERVAAARAYLGLAVTLAQKRRTAARELARRVAGELTELAMPATRFDVRFEPAEVPASGELPADRDGTSGWGERGLDRAEFLLSPNPGEELRPLARIASGGELSRILLALKSVATLDHAGQTLVFDEVDAGIGGAVAETVGRKLRAMARRHQVLCVTHLPQIAALADTHFTIRKRVAGRRTLTELARLDAEARVEEIARMVGGETITEAARRHAREMLRLDVR